MSTELTKEPIAKSKKRTSGNSKRVKKEAIIMPDLTNVDCEETVPCCVAGMDEAKEAAVCNHSGSTMWIAIRFQKTKSFILRAIKDVLRIK